MSGPQEEKAVCRLDPPESLTIRPSTGLVTHLHQQDSLGDGKTDLTCQTSLGSSDTSLGSTYLIKHGAQVANPPGGWRRMRPRKIARRFKGSRVLPRNFSTAMKWWVLVVVFIVQMSMNYNAAVYAFAVDGIAADFEVTEHRAKAGQWLFLLAYAFGCELWAPFSEEFGRRLILQLSLWLVNLCILAAALSPTDTGIYVARFFAGLCSAGGSVTLGIVADMYGPWTHHFALGFIVLASCAGSVVGPLVGGALQQYMHWRWVFWTQLIFGVATAALHLAACPETDLDVCKNKQAKQLREEGAGNIVGPTELEPSKLNARDLLRIMYRPFKMLATEPIVLALSLLSGFSDALIFTFLESYSIVFNGLWGFDCVQVGLAFSPLIVGYVLAYGMLCIDFVLQRRQAAACNNSDPPSPPPPPERRLKSLLFLGPLLPLGLALFGLLTSGHEAGMPWIAPLLASVLVGIANYAIYMATVDYMVAAYGAHFAASATGGNGFCRDFLAGVAAFYSEPLYRNLGSSPRANHVQRASWLLAGLALGLVGPVFALYFKGDVVRSRSKMAVGLDPWRSESIANDGRTPGDDEATVAATEEVTRGMTLRIASVSYPTAEHRE